MRAPEREQRPQWAGVARINSLPTTVMPGRAFAQPDDRGSGWFASRPRTASFKMEGTMRYTTLLLLLLCAAPAVADDGTMFRRNISGTPENETEFAAIRMLPLYVPAQNTAEEPVTISYPNAEGIINEADNRTYARPLIGHYTDGPVTMVADSGGFPGHGKRDAFGAVSLDDGATWKRTNLSKSADLSSFKTKVGRKWVPYPGDVGRTFAASDGNKVLIAWVSRYCGGGNPNYAMTSDQRDLIANYLGNTAWTDDDTATVSLYLDPDLFGVPGSQGSSDLADEGYPSVGVLPYQCVWTARGVMNPPDATTGQSSFTWFKAERLTSGVRDANRPEAMCVKGAGCVVTWQEDPDGIRPGEGEGPGEGWSGAVAHHQTDTWYSYISWDNFGKAGTITVVDGEYTITPPSTDTAPQVAIPFAMPMRLTDNAMCTAEVKDANGAVISRDDPYCYADFDGNGVADLCFDKASVTLETPEGLTQTIDLCIAEDGRLMRGNTASTRARLGLHGYSSQGIFDKTQPDLNPIDRAWFYMTYEENKGLGDEGEDETTAEDLIDKVDMGKNVWYHTFDMFQPEVASQGLMLNQPAVYQDDFANPEGFLTAYGDLGYNFYQIDPDPVYETLTGGKLDTTLLQSEISRRPSPISQDWYDAGPSGTVALQLWKQGIIRRGGPADIMGRRFVMPTTGEEVCTTVRKVCTTTEECSTEQVCVTEPVCVANTANPAYKPNPGSCKKTPLPLSCYPYLDQDGNPTLLAETCSDVTTCEDVTTCKDVTVCDEPVEGSCEAVTTCEDPETCAPVITCEESRQCTGGVDPTKNPYDYANMECKNADGTSAWAFTDGTNPRYVKGLCAAPAINLSGNTIQTGETCADATACLDAFPFNEYFDDLAGGTVISKIYEWAQYGPGYGEEPPDNSNLDDTSWANPYDMAKGHRGFMTGDMIMAMYAWTNNWKALTDAHDIVNLYVRRSFDGGKTWSTLPDKWTHTDGVEYTGDGTTTCEWMEPEGVETPVCAPYAAGVFEPARNVSQLRGSKVTVLDPRYSPTTRTINAAWVNTASLPAGFFPKPGQANLYADDTRNPSRFFMIYETGQSSAYDAGEAPPLDLFYSRAVNWGEDYLVWQDEADADACLPSADTEDDWDLTGFCNEFDALEGSQLLESGEASVTASPGGQFFYAIWNQWDFDKDGNEIRADAWFRRVLFLDGYIPPAE